ncbi:DUF4229 domain-containing protein [Cellulomonas endophytica]|uniref:DUF4229 domain-containing protein n=1 Tax=Cellulomonas endophytica TaxID=2494735 RepID=UPI001013399A|nr:DUF4229 domain-containing protein [Cellulomonas endophytica]
MPLLVYSLLRLALFAVCWVALVLVGMGSWLSVVVAVVLAACLSYLLLARPRAAAAVWLQERDEARRARRAAAPRRGVERDADEEDADVEAVRPGRVPGQDAGDPTA